jgi:hypothetical protein
LKESIKLFSKSKSSNYQKLKIEKNMFTKNKRYPLATAKVRPFEKYHS